jgi:uncharacterized membrane protein YhaH (DUF805 family)
MLAMQIFFIGVAFIPLAAAASRRYQDTGLPAGDLWQGSRPAVIAFVSGYFLFRSLQIMSMDFFEAGPAGLISGAIIFAIAILPFLVFAPVAPSLLGETIGQLLVPSQPHPNTYGPNPLEVTP